jgi:hypothetical protein
LAASLSPDGGRGREPASAGLGVRRRRYVSFMYSYPNLIPLGERAIRRIPDSIRPFPFERVYGGWNGRVVRRDGAHAVERSADRYLRCIRDGREGRQG